MANELMEEKNVSDARIVSPLAGMLFEHDLNARNDLFSIQENQKSIILEIRKLQAEMQQLKHIIRLM